MARGNLDLILRALRSGRLLYSVLVFLSSWVSSHRLWIFCIFLSVLWTLRSILNLDNILRTPRIWQSLVGCLPRPRKIGFSGRRLHGSERKMSRTRSPRGKSPSGRVSRWPCKDYLKGTCNNSFCKKWHPPECLFCKTKSGCKFGENCSHAHRQVDEQPSKRSKKNGDKSAVAMLKKHELYDRTVKLVVCRDTRHEQGHGPVVCNSSSTRQLGCVFQDMEPPKSSLISRKSSDMRKPIQRVKFTKAIARHTKIRDQNPSLGMICPVEPHQRGPNASKF